MHIFFCKDNDFFLSANVFGDEIGKNASFSNPIRPRHPGAMPRKRHVRTWGGARSHAPRGAARAGPTPFPYFRFVNVQLFNYSIIQLKNVPREMGGAEKKVPIY